jgi:hypothetical protein
MNGAIGAFLRPQAGEDDRNTVHAIFKERFHTLGGWQTFLATYIPGQSVEALLARSAAAWEVAHFQALYVACWIFHPVEKGSYMLRIDGKGGQEIVRSAYDRLLTAKKLQSRISSHLSKKGASAHEGWNFLVGYDELLVQIEEQGQYLFLKCEGHPMDGALSTVMHGLSWVKKKATGSGKTASAALNNFAKTSVLVEARAAENYSKAYEKLVGKLGFSGILVTVAEVLDRLLLNCGKQGVPPQIRGDSKALGHAMLGADGYIKAIQQGKGKKKIDFSPELADELTAIANRLVTTAESHPVQYFNEVRVTAGELSGALKEFERHAGG